MVWPSEFPGKPPPNPSRDIAFGAPIFCCGNIVFSTHDFPNFDTVLILGGGMVNWASYRRYVADRISGVE
ncbi:hypothetical protein CDD81_2308 [Ophiocordyceps australis]|uniref:Uncharacterized protein n=1 Tax=Ophiocordyceps australis TaxID=1399860 RepID=A0A2C5XK83_9HYPO|nr:hypothetical protein CDD81_2308 [Ophiocordyceps australis]